MSYLSLSDIAGQSETTEAQAPTLTLDDLNQLSEADGQKPPTVDGADVTSPSAPAVVPPTDRVIDPLLSGVFGQNNQQSVDAEGRLRRQPPSGEPPQPNLERTGRNAAPRADQYRGPTDPAGFPIDTSRPLVVVDGDVATERTATMPGTALGMPMDGVFFNIPTIINGQPMSPEAAAQLTAQLIKAGEISLDDIPRFNSEQEAVSAAMARSNAIGELRGGEIEDLISDEQIKADRAEIREVLAQPGPTREKAALFNNNESASTVRGEPGQFFDISYGQPIAVSDEDAAMEIRRANRYRASNNAFSRGYGRLRQAFNVLGEQVGLKSPEEFVRTMAELDRIYPDAPADIQKGLQEISEAKGVMGSLKAIANNPKAVASVVGESLVVAVPSLATFIAGSATTTPAGGAAAAGTVTFGTTFASIITDEIRASGVSVQDEAAMMELMGDQAFWDRAKKRATGYAIPIAVFDALSMGLAGKLVGAGVQSGKSGLNIAGRAATETALQMTAGAAGEAGGQTAEKLLGFRDTYTPGEIVLEAVAEGPIGIAEMAISTPSQIKAARETQFNNALEEAEAQANEQAATQTAIDLLNPRSSAYGNVDPAEVGATNSLTLDDVQAAPVQAQTDAPEPIEAPAAETPVEVPTQVQSAPVATETPAAAPPPQQEAPPQPTQTAPVEPPVAEPVQTQDSPQKTETPVGKPVNEQQPAVSTVQTPDSQASYEVETVVVELADLKQAQGILQPRDRSLAESTVEAQRRASPEQFNPGRLLDSPTTGDGAPIIARDGTIMSGNGRVLTLNEVYANQPASRAAYTKALQDSGVDLANYSNPVLVRRLTDTNMSVDDLKTFADLANTDAQARMSTTETAQRDAQRMPPETVNLFTGGDLTSLENKPFVDAFVRQVLSPTEQGQFSRDGRLTKDAVSRMQSAILATAYSDTDALAIMLDSTDDNIKAISNAMMMAAPKVSQLKADIAAGDVRSEFDVSQQITDAAKLISDLRSRNIKPRDYYDQQDAFSDADPIVEAIVRSLYNDDLTRAKSQKFMRDVLEFYVEESGNRKSDGLFEDNTTPTDVIKAARAKAERKADGTEGQGSLLPESSDGGSVETSREQTQSTRRKRSSEDTGKVDFQRSGKREERQVDDARPESTVAESVTPDAELRGSETTTSNPAEVILREDAEGSTRGAKSGRVLTQEKETLRQSVFQQAFTDAGFDPNVAVNMKPAQQFRILSKLVSDKFGFKYIARPETNSYDANQALLDAYRNLQWMTNSLGFPASSIGLDNSLGLALPGQAWGGYLAAYINKQGGPAAETQSDIGKVPAPVVIMPKRSNSFAHEWGHALDYHILDKLGESWSRGITGRIRSNMKSGERAWQDTAPKSVQDAMGDLINAMFFDQAETAAKIMQLEQQIAKTQAYEQKTGKTTKKLATLEEQLRRLKEGSTRSQISKTNYRKEAEEFAVATESDVDYWTRPTEMFARAFETYVAKIVEQKGGTTEFITMQNEAYEMTRDQVEGSDIRLALTYPNEGDRNNIMLAMDRLMEALRTEMFQGVVAEKPGDYDMIDARRDFAAQIDEGMSKNDIAEMVKDERRSWLSRQTQITKDALRPQRFPEKSAFSKRFIGIEDAVISRVLYAKRGVLFSISGRYKDNKPVRNILEDIISRVATDPGGRRKTFEGGTFEEAATLASRRFASRYKSIIDQYGLAEMSPEELSQLRLVLTADPDAQSAALQGVAPKITQAAGDIRNKILNPMYDYMRKSGMEITYLQDGSYMPRMLDNLLVSENENDFMYGDGRGSKRGAFNMYHDVIYENEMGPMTEGDIDQMRSLANLGRRLPLDEETADQVLDMRGALNRLAKLNSALENETDGGVVASIESDIEAVMEELNELHPQVYEALRTPFAETSARDWMQRISLQAGADPEAHAAQNSFMKKRKMPPEADTYMVDFYLDPIESLNLYIPAVARKVEGEKRFGKHLVPKGSKLGALGKGPHDTIDFLEYQIQEAQKKGLDATDAQNVRLIVNKILGRDGAVKDFTGKKALDYLHTYGTMALLPRAVISSVAEPLTAGIQTGSVKKGAETFFRVFDEALGMVNKNARERTLFYRQMANILGVVDDPSVGEMVANRLGGTLAEDPKLNARLNRFFVRTKLQGITNAQRRSTMRTFLQFFAEISAEYQGADTTPEAKRRIENIFQDMGIYGDNLDQFTKWMADSKEGQFKAPKLDEMMERNGELTDMGNLLAIAVGRATDQTIQDPKSVDRPMYAEHPVGRLVFGIQSFMRAYTRNVLIGSAKKVNREFQDNGAVSGTTMLALQMIPNFALLYGGHLLVSTLREVLMNPDAIEREREDDNLTAYLMELGFSRAGFYGAADPFVNMFKSLRYEADSKTILVGASLSFYGRSLDRMLGYFTKNSPNTVAAEYQTAVGFWDMFVTTGVSAVASMPGPGPILGPALGLGAAAVTSPATKHGIIREFIKLVYDEEYKPGRGGRQKSKPGINSGSGGINSGINSGGGGIND